MGRRILIGAKYWHVFYLIHHLHFLRANNASKFLFSYFLILVMQTKPAFRSGDRDCLPRQNLRCFSFLADTPNMLFIWSWLSAIPKVFANLLSYALSPFSLISSSLARSFLPPRDKRSTDTECNSPSSVAPATITYDPYVRRLQLQHDLSLVGVGAACLVYNVSDQVVLKACRVFEQPGDDAPEIHRQKYASDTLFHRDVLENERFVLRLLQKKPHSHIVEAIDTDHPEGFYLRKYKPLSANTGSTQPTRIEWYYSLTDALRHLHSFGILHNDIRMDNILLDHRDLPVLCDFSVACLPGRRNFVSPNRPLPINGPSPTLSQASDMFALASLVFDMEHQSSSRPYFQNGSLVLPKIESGHQGLDKVIRNSWFGKYIHTSEMLQDLKEIVATVDDTAEHALPLPESRLACHEQIRHWRQDRENKFGKAFPSVLFPRLSNLRHPKVVSLLVCHQRIN